MIETISPAELNLRDLDKTYVLDVRAPGEYAAGHIPGAINVPLDSLGELVPDLREASARRELVVVCAAGSRSATACERLAAADVRATGLTGGTQAWQAAGLPVDTAPHEGRAVWAMDRQVRFTAGMLVLTGLAVGLRAPRARLISAGVASGLVYSGLSNTCGMAAVLGKLPFNRPSSATLDSTRRALRD
ncbi:rhodanese-like domain-containing protein [Streptomyces sp. NBC_01465]|uniref:rhodanese-like domain-containing protein n=1 Tax=Streptomyces sp. NBC_01465 TaxID=2903878 RepID=UPI002E30FC3A|nr:rhodanese-like domain-containing protein [Streptomyces sp. NBC_01465]